MEENQVCKRSNHPIHAVVKRVEKKLPDRLDVSVVDTGNIFINLFGPKSACVTRDRKLLMQFGVEQDGSEAHLINMPRFMKMVQQDKNNVDIGQSCPVNKIDDFVYNMYYRSFEKN